MSSSKYNFDRLRIPGSRITKSSKHNTEVRNKERMKTEILQVDHFIMIMMSL